MKFLLSLIAVVLGIILAFMNWQLLLILLGICIVATIFVFWILLRHYEELREELDGREQNRKGRS
jgi:ABC-type bacteriocin/lantibiotic exporter with double-glycine peptidase domain